MMVTNTVDCVCYVFELLPANITCLEEIINVIPRIILALYAVRGHVGVTDFTNSPTVSSETKLTSSSKQDGISSVKCVTLDSYV